MQVNLSSALAVLVVHAIVPLKLREHQLTHKKEMQVVTLEEKSRIAEVQTF